MQASELSLCPTGVSFDTEGPAKTWDSFHEEEGVWNPAQNMKMALVSLKEKERLL